MCAPEQRAQRQKQTHKSAKSSSGLASGLASGLWQQSWYTLTYIDGINKIASFQAYHVCTLLSLLVLFDSALLPLSWLSFYECGQGW
jgi:hypothetical protein